MRFHLHPMLSVCVLLLTTVLQAQSNQAKEAIPTGEALVDATSLVKDVYKTDFSAAKTPDLKKALVQKLLEGAKDEKGAGRYALLSKAKDAAIEYGDVDGCDAALDGIEASFEVDSLKVRSEAYSALARSVRTPADRKRLGAETSATVQAALGVDRFDVAKAAAEVGLANARSGGDPELAKVATSNLQAVREAESAYADVKKALLALVDKPNDPDANLKVGKYRCFTKGDWKNGLPMLTQGSDAKLRTLAEQEVAGVSTVEEQAKMGDGWWEAGARETGAAQRCVRGHAVDFYKVVLPSLSGLAKAKVESRIKEIAEDGSRPSPTPKATISARSIEVESTDHWTKTDAAVEEGKCYEIVAKGSWRGSNGINCGPEGCCPPNLFSPLGPQPGIKKDEDTSYYLGRLPKNALIGQFQGENWSFYIGKKMVFYSPMSTTLSFRINDSEIASTTRQGKAQLEIREITPVWVGPDGKVSVAALLDDEDHLHFTAEGLFWEYGGHWNHVGQFNGTFPTIINGICWWPQWSRKDKSDLLPVKQFWPGDAKDFSLVAVDAKRGDVKLKQKDGAGIVLTFKDNGGGPSAVACTIRVPPPKLGRP